MALTSGTKLGPYEIVSPIGAGGMGQVYKARDTRLNRFVAVKILREDFPNKLDLKARFEREAQTLARLSHPHICPVFDVGQQDAIDYLVMEYLEGQTLAQKLEHGALPIQDALKIGIEIADGLDKAHQQGIVHRDLKPGNIMLTKAGVKLLDFGLAKLKQMDQPTALSEFPTNASMTAQGTILGTLQYIAPEQLEGQEADARSDIFAFGAVLYEMFTGRRAFQGKSQASLISAILSSQPTNPSQTVPEVPVVVDHIIDRCLAKDPAQRWHSAHDVLLELEWIRDYVRRDEKTTDGEKPRRQAKVAGVALAVFAVAAIGFSILYFRQGGPSGPAVAETRFEIPVAGMTSAFYISVSPDGRRVAYIADAGNGRTALWVRPLNSLNAQLLPGTEGASPPDWSPDGRSIVFAADGKLKKVEVGGGPPQTLIDLRKDLRGIFTRSTWTRDGTILFAVNDGTGIRKISASGGEATAITELDNSLEETAHSTPWFLPDGRHFLYTAWSRKPENRAIYIGSIDSKDRKRLMSAQSKAIYSPPGILLFLRERTLVARPFDLNRLEFSGEAVPIAEEVGYSPTLGQSAFYASSEGTLIYYRSVGAVLPTGAVQWYWMDRSGKISAPVGDSNGVTDRRLSPDGKRIVFSELVGGSRDIWVYDIDRNLRTRLTSDPAADLNPIWSPDGSRFVFASDRGNSRFVTALYQKMSNGAVPEDVILAAEPGMSVVPADWSSDGRLIVFEKYKSGSETNQRDLWVLPLSGDRKPTPYLATSFDERQPALSPNGRWLAYASNESGAFQIVVQPFPAPTLGKWQISTNGGAFPRWKRDGSELYYIDANDQMISVSVKADNAFEVGKSAPLFPLSEKAAYDVTADGQGFLISRRAGLIPSKDSIPITVILNWYSILKR